MLGEKRYNHRSSRPYRARSLPNRRCRGRGCPRGHSGCLPSSSAFGCYIIHSRARHWKNHSRFPKEMCTQSFRGNPGKPALLRKPRTGQPSFPSIPSGNAGLTPNPSHMGSQRRRPPWQLPHHQSPQQPWKAWWPCRTRPPMAQPTPPRTPHRAPPNLRPAS